MDRWVPLPIVCTIREGPSIRSEGDLGPSVHICRLYASEFDTTSLIDFDPRRVRDYFKSDMHMLHAVYRLSGLKMQLNVSCMIGYVRLFNIFQVSSSSYFGHIMLLMKRVWLALVAKIKACFRTLEATISSRSQSLSIDNSR